MTYICNTPSSGTFTYNTPSNLGNFPCDTEYRLNPRIIPVGCPTWSGLYTDVAIDGRWYDNLELVLTHQTSDYELYETDYSTHTVNRINIDASPYLGYDICTPYHSSFSFKVYVLVCTGLPYIRTYVRVNDVKSNTGGNLFGDSLFDYDALSCPSGYWQQCGPNTGTIIVSGVCCEIIQSGVLRYA